MKYSYICLKYIRNKMFGPSNILDYDMTKELTVEQLILKTKNSEDPLWLKTNYQKYDTYHFEHEVNEEIKLCFKVFFSLIHDNHAVNIYMLKNKSGRKNLFIARGEKVSELIKAIKESKKYY